MNRYPKYKPSGVEWIGEIPDEWELKRLKYELIYQKGKNPKELTFDEKGKPYLTMEYLRNNSKQIFYVEDFENYVIVAENEILLLWDGSNAGEFIRSKEGVLSSTMALLKICNQDNNYAWYFFKVLENHLRESTIGMGVPHVNREELRNQYFILPPKPEQTAIARYLDDKTGKIDTLIEKKNRLIDLLKEERTAVINKAVTRGVNPNVKLKPSGIEWLGDIPEHWEVKKLKYIFQLSRGFDLSSNNFETGVIPVCGSNGIIGYHNKSTVKGPGITVGRSGSVGEVNFIETDFWAHNTCLYVYKNFDNNLKYIFYFLRVFDLKSLSSGSAVGTLNRNYIHAENIAFPTKFEQNQIVQHIEAETKRIDCAISKIEKEIELLIEYRIALISEVVTGKIKVA